MTDAISSEASMRLLHTSDWHLGQTLLGHDREAEHAAFLDWLLDQLEQRAIDALLIAGDIFDQASPSAEAQRLYYQFIGQALRRCPALEIVVIAGNHDSPGRIDAPHPVLHALGVHVIGHFRTHRAIDPRVRIGLRRSDGSIGAWLLAVPFLRPADLPKRSVDAYLEGVAASYREVVDAALAVREPGQALLAMGHLHVQGGLLSELSERKLVIGGQEALDASIFPAELAYVALGHLHLAQTVGQPRIRYSGSPLPLSFAETGYPHQVVEVLLAGERLLATTAIPVPRPAALWRVPEAHLPLDQVLPLLRALEAPAATVRGLQPLIEVRVELAPGDTSVRAQVEQALAGKAVRLGRIDPLRRSGDPLNPSPADVRLSLDQLRPEPLFLRLVEEHTGAPPAADLIAAFSELLAQAEAAER